MHAHRLFHGLGLEQLLARASTADPDFDELCIDARELRPGSLFIARRAYFGNTHERLGEAVARGAAGLVVSEPEHVPSDCAVPVWLAPDDDPTLAALSSRFYGEPCAELAVFAVTGTNGKTSTAFLLEHLLRALGRRVALLGTVAYRLGEVEIPACNTTPDALYVQRFARKAREAGADTLVLEASSHALAIGRLEGLLPDCVGFGNLSHEHLDFHGDLEAYFAAKARLFGPLLAAAIAAGKRPTALAQVRDDGWGARILALTPSDVRRCPLGTDAAPWRLALRQPLGARGMLLELSGPGQRYRCRSPLLGHYNLENLELALAMVLARVPQAASTLAAALGSFGGIPGRLEAPVESGLAPQGVFVDYAHTPRAVASVCAVVAESCGQAPNVVLGCGGDRDPSKRAPMAAAALAHARALWVTSDNPRSEAPEAIVAQMLDSHESGQRSGVHLVLDRGEAIGAALAEREHGPVLIVGKGHEPYQEIAGVRYAFDDRDEVRRQLAAQLWYPSAAHTPSLCGWSAERIARSVGGPLLRPRRGPWRGVALRGGPVATLDKHIVFADSAPPDPDDALWIGAHPQSCIRIEDPLRALERLALAVVREALRRSPGLRFEPAASPADETLALDFRASASWPPASEQLLRLCRLSPSTTCVHYCGPLPEPLRQLAQELAQERREASVARVPVPRELTLS